MGQVDWTQWSLSYTDDIFGPLYGGHSVIIAATNTLKMWLPAYIAEMNRNLGAPVLAVPKDYEFRPQYSPAPPSGNSPFVLVDVPGTTQTPVRRSDGIQSYWKTQIGVWLFGSQSWRETQALTYAYMAAIRAVMIQQPKLGGLADTVKWMEESYAEKEHSSTRTVGQGFLQFEVSILTSIEPFAGPSVPSLQLPATPPEVLEVNIDIDKEEP